MSNGRNGSNGNRKSLSVEPAHPPRTLPPRKPTYESRRIIAYDGESVLIERTGEILPASDLPLVLVREPSSLLICEGAASLLAELNHTPLASIAGWQYRVAPVVRRVYRQHRRSKPTETHDVIVAFLGWKHENGNTHYHYPLDPLVFSGNTIGQLVCDGGSRLANLLKWGIDVRDFCRTHGLKVTSGSGALAVQLLKDARFYPEKRRKVPHSTNSRAREHLPGNHYELFTEERRYHDAFYLDMRSAHHHVATDLAFPCANGLLARGRFRDPISELGGVDAWIRPGDRAYRTLLHSHGLLLVRIQNPHLARGSFAPPYMKKPGTRLAWIYTNEIPTIYALGGVIEGIDAAWTSFHADEGLNRYARWAIAEAAAMTPDRKRWGKATLLAAYGMLAARPTAREFGYRHAKSGTPHTYRTNSGPLPAMIVQQSHETESPVVNVIQRGMIEAEIRLQVLAMARELHSFGCNVLCVYADSVIVESSSALPLLPDPWDVKTPLSRLQFFNPTSFHSEEMVRLPGIPEGVNRLSYVKMMAALTRDVDTRGRARMPDLSRTPQGRSRFPMPREIRRMTRAFRRELR